MIKKMILLSILLTFNLTLFAATKTITVVGEGRLEVKPDRATITLGVESADSDIEVALKSNSKKIKLIIDGLMELGIKKERLKTSNLSLYQYKPYNGNGVEEYRISNMITITVDNLELLDTTLERSVKLGANSINGVNFYSSSLKNYEKELRKKAIENAREEAEFIAELEGLRVKEVLNISEYSSNGAPVPISVKGFNSESGYGSSLLQSGSNMITVKYIVEYRLVTK